jgi:hypothetical protein
MTTILAVFAVLFQATLFACHHHSLTFSSRHVSAATVVAATDFQLPAAIDHDCEICFVIGHQHGAVPIDLSAATLPQHPPLGHRRIEAVATFNAAHLLFYSRAPPLG